MSSWLYAWHLRHCIHHELQMTIVLYVTVTTASVPGQTTWSDTQSFGGSQGPAQHSRQRRNDSNCCKGIIDLQPWGRPFQKTLVSRVLHGMCVTARNQCSNVISKSQLPPGQGFDQREVWDHQQSRLPKGLQCANGPRVYRCSAFKKVSQLACCIN